MTPSDDTIFAPASGQGRAALAVIRISGDRTRDVLAALAGGVPAEARRLGLRTLKDPANGEALDRALVVYMPAPSSFTGEDQAELHVHGGAAVRSAVLEALLRLEGCRPAEPGEFTRRAFLNGRMDLSAVEGLADLIDAETAAQRRQALRQMDGHLGQRIAAWREGMVTVLAGLEAILDFSDEGDVPSGPSHEAQLQVEELRAEITAVLADGHRGERLREGFTVALVGPPNAGKSTLLNALARRDVAIVSPLPGTTRDAIEVRLDLKGFPVMIVDTAGLRDSMDPVEREGVARTRVHLDNADLVLWLIPADAASPPVKSSGAARPPLTIGTKRDLGEVSGGGVDLAISALDGSGMDALIERIAAEAGQAMGGEAVLTRERHRQAVQRVVDALGRAIPMLASGHHELAAEDLRLAWRTLGAVTGHVDLDQILDQVFATFCIGK